MLNSIRKQQNSSLGEVGSTARLVSSFTNLNLTASLHTKIHFFLVESSLFNLETSRTVGRHLIDRIRVVLQKGCVLYV